MDKVLYASSKGCVKTMNISPASSKYIERG